MLCSVHFDRGYAFLPSACHFTRLTSAQIPPPVQASSYRTEPPALPIRSLWAGIDVVHASVQKLQQTLAAVNYVPVGCETDVEAVDDFILLAVRLDARLVDLCNSVHAFLGRPWVASGVPEGELASMRFDSDRRIRKCLRLAA